MNELPPMTLLDHMVSTKENIMLKAFLPYINKGFQPFLATYIKYTELIATVELFKNNNGSFPSYEEGSSFPDIISALLPYVSEQERQTFEMLGNMKNIMETFEQYKDIFEAGVNADQSFQGGSDTDDGTDSPNGSSSDSSNENSNGDSNSDSDNSQSDEGQSSGTMADTLSAFLTPEQQLMFEQLSSLMN